MASSIRPIVCKKGSGYTPTTKRDVTDQIPKTPLAMLWSRGDTECSDLLQATELATKPCSKQTGGSYKGVSAKIVGVLTFRVG